MPGAVDPFAHWSGLSPKVVHYAAYPFIRRSNRQNKLRVWKLLVELTKQYWPRIVLKGVVLWNKTQSEVESFHADVWICDPVRSCHAVAKTSQCRRE